MRVAKASKAPICVGDSGSSARDRARWAFNNPEKAKQIKDAYNESLKSSRDYHLFRTVYQPAPQPAPAPQPLPQLAPTHELTVLDDFAWIVWVLSAGH